MYKSLYKLLHHDLFFLFWLWWIIYTHGMKEIPCKKPKAFSVVWTILIWIIIHFIVVISFYWLFQELFIGLVLLRILIGWFVIRLFIYFFIIVPLGYIFSVFLLGIRFSTYRVVAIIIIIIFTTSHINL